MKSFQFILLCCLLIITFSLYGQLTNPTELTVPKNWADNSNQASNTYASPTIATQNQSNISPELASLLQHTLDSIQQANGIVGIGAAFRTPEGDIWASGSGISHELPETEKITADHRFAWGSITKTLTAACILQLYEEGELDLDDPLGEYLPPLTNINPLVTIRQLLNHTGGVHDYVTNPGLLEIVFDDASKTWTVPEIIETLVLNETFEPGTNWDYSNTGYLLLGEIIETITGNTYINEINERFATPLNLNTGFYPPYETWQQPTAHLWTDFDGDEEVEDDNELFQNFSSLYTIAGSAGAYFSNPTDLVNWIWALQAGNVLSEQTKLEMREFVPANEWLYGLGTMEIDFSGETGWGHGGDIFYSASAFYFERCKVTIGLQVNDQRLPAIFLPELITALLNTYKAYTSPPPLSITDGISSNFNCNLSPNPFKNKLQIQYELLETTDLEISIFDIYGRLIQQQYFNNQTGHQSWNWDGKNNRGISVSNGVYVVNINNGKQSFSSKILKQ